MLFFFFGGGVNFIDAVIWQMSEPMDGDEFGRILLLIFW